MPGKSAKFRINARQKCDISLKCPPAQPQPRRTRPSASSSRDRWGWRRCSGQAGTVLVSTVFTKKNKADVRVLAPLCFFLVVFYRNNNSNLAFRVVFFRVVFCRERMLYGKLKWKNIKNTRQKTNKIRSRKRTKDIRRRCKFHVFLKVWCGKVNT